jgi:hypothetical protein
VLQCSLFQKVDAFDVNRPCTGKTRHAVQALCVSKQAQCQLQPINNCSNSVGCHPPPHLLCVLNVCRGR